MSRFADSVLEIPTEYLECLGYAERLLAPLQALMLPDAADIPLQGSASNHGPAADRLESFARPCLLAAHWLAASGREHKKLSTTFFSNWFRQGLVNGTNPARAHYWGSCSNQHQHVVEMAALVLALEIAKADLWDPLTTTEKAQVAAWFASIRGCALHRNNHLFFGVLPLCFLEKHGFGEPMDRICIDRWLDILESMSLGGGWFIDGSNESLDHYNAFAFHYYSIWWAKLYGARDSARVSRWHQWTREFLPDYVHFFAASGEPVAFGRSLTYRFATSAPFALAEKCGLSALPPGLSRRVSMQCLRFFFEQDILQSQGALSIGWTDDFPAISEPYSCAGSPYWAAKGFAALLLPPESPFWTDQEIPLPAERGDFSHPLPQVGLLLRGDGGAVELINAGTAIGGANEHFGAYKWGKLSYRTACGFEVQPKGAPYPIDAALSAQSEDGALYGRRWTNPLIVSADEVICSYALGDRHTQFHAQIQSHLLWRGGWQFQFHRCFSHQATRLILGAYSLASPEAGDLSVSGNFPFMVSQNGRLAVALQALMGFESHGHRLTLDGRDQRSHTLAANSSSLYLQTPLLQGMCSLAALTWIGPAEASPSAWSIISSRVGRLVLSQPHGVEWEICLAGIPKIPFPL